MTTDTVIETMVERIVGRFQPARILLFGSRARGSANRWSDVDLLVVMEEVTDKRRAAVEMGRVLSDLPVSKDIIVTTPEEIARRGHLVGTVLRAALRDGKVVYERTLILSSRRPSVGFASPPRTSMLPNGFWQIVLLPRDSSVGSLSNLLRKR